MANVQPAAPRRFAIVAGVIVTLPVVLQLQQMNAEIGVWMVAAIFVLQVHRLLPARGLKLVRMAGVIALLMAVVY